MGNAKKPASAYIYHTDPGHGWLQVERSELLELGIIANISSYSYQHEGYVYLEEDYDMGVFLDAKLAKGEEVEVDQIPQRYMDDSFVRDLPSFSIAGDLK